jgi:hypothetical protein
MLRRRVYGRGGKSDGSCAGICTPKWGDKKFLEIRRRAVNDLLDDIEDRHSAAMADYVLATVRGVMTWYQSKYENYVSPIVKGMRKGKPKARDLNSTTMKSAASGKRLATAAPLVRC